MILITKYATRTLERMNREKQTKYNPYIVIAIIAVMIGMVKIWWNCNKYFKSPREAFSKTGPLTRHKLIRIAKNKLKEEGLDETMCVFVVDQALEEFHNMSNEEIQSVIKEVKK